MEQLSQLLKIKAQTSADGTFATTSSDVLKYALAEWIWIAVLASGTEPKSNSTLQL